MAVLLGVLGYGCWAALGSSYSARLIRKLSLAGAPLPGLLPITHPHTTNVFLTFDDGPSPKLTPKVLDLLAAHGAKATFFVCGRQVALYPQLAARIRQEGHALANHTYTHPYLTNVTVTAALEEVDHCQQLIAPLGAAKIFRPPHGLLSARLLTALVRRGYQIAFWSQDSGDWGNGSETELAARLVQQVHGGDVIILHDDQPNSIRVLELFFAGTATNHFHFAPLPGAIP